MGLFAGILMLSLASFGCGLLTYPLFSATELQALHDLYVANDGEHWAWRKNTTLFGIPWNFSDPISANPCAQRWQGVSCISATSSHPNCSAVPCSIEGLQLSRMGLSGFLPPSIANLSSLEVLDLTVNTMVDGIPESIGNLSGSLRLLRLGYNYFSGSLPQSLYQLNHLTNLDISRNQFTGSIDCAVGNMTSLQVLELDSNWLTGPLPDSLLSLRALRDVSFDYNSFSQAFPAFSNLSTPLLRSLSSMNSGLEGSLPDGYFTLRNLEVLTIGSNDLTGSLSPSISNCHNLTVLSIIESSLTGIIPPEIGQLSKLEVLKLINCPKMHGSAPASLGNLQYLRVLQIRGNVFNGTWPVSLTKFSAMEDFELTSNHFEGHLPQPDANGSAITKLRFLYLDYNRFNGIIPESWRLLQGVEILSVNNNFLTGSLPNSVFQYFASLIEFNGYYNRFTGPLPVAMFTNMTSLSKVLLFSNSIEGTLPGYVSWESSQLQSLLLDYNYLSGPIPESMCSLSNLESFDFAGNKFSRTLPNCFWNMSSLRSFELNVNFLTGSIPSFAHLSRIVNIDMSSNYLSRHLPNDVNSSNGLQTLALSSNMLDGPFPDSLFGLSALYSVDISYNFLTGKLPLNQTANAAKAISTIIVNSNQLTGDIADLFANVSSTITALLVGTNFLTGQIVVPDSANYLIADLDISENLLSGSLSSSISRLSVLSSFLFQENMISATLPTSIGQLHQLAVLNASLNRLDGALPTTICQCQMLAIVDVSYNAITGSVHNRFNCSASLSYLYLQGNRLSGTLDNLLSDWTMPLTIDISDNQFSGPLPTAEYMWKTMNTFSAVKNCLTGSLPNSMCSARSLMSLALDGLHSSDVCTTKIFGALSGEGALSDVISQSSYILQSAIKGVIPTCLYELPRLQLLHLSGNGLVDSFDQLVNSTSHRSCAATCCLSKSLQDLSLSHNALFGTIPRCLQTRNWTNFDLSFNGFDGELVEDLGSYSAIRTVNQLQLSLSMNKLSGDVPASIQELRVVDVLTGNIFGCPAVVGATDRTLPDNDHASASYSCGSNTVDVALLIFASAVVFVFLLLMMLFVRQVCVDRCESPLDAASDTTGPHRHTAHHVTLGKLLQRRIIAWYSGPMAWHKTSLQISSSDDVRIFFRFNRRVRQATVIISFALITIFLVLYSSLSRYFSTHKYKYAYSTGFMFLIGQTPAVAMFVFASVACVVLMYSIRNGFFLRRENEVVGKSDDTGSQCTRASADLPSGDEQLKAPTTAQFTATTETTPVAAGSNCGSRDELLPVVAMFWRLARYWIAPVVMLWLCVLLTTLTVNMAYVYAESIEYSSNAVLPLISLGMSIFKILWNDIFVLRLIPRYLHHFKRLTLRHILSHLNVEHEHTRSPAALNSLRDWISKCLQPNSEWFDRSILIMSLFISMFSNVFAPYISSIFVNANCFYYTVNTMTPVETSYSYTHCLEYEDASLCRKVSYLSRTISYLPPFIYSYQCSSSLMQSFIAVFMYRYLISSFALPLVGLAASVWYARLRRHRSESTRVTVGGDGDGNSNMYGSGSVSRLVERAVRKCVPLARRIVIDHFAVHSAEFPNEHRDVELLRSFSAINRKARNKDSHCNDESLGQGSQSFGSSQYSQALASARSPLHSTEQARAVSTSMYVFPAVHQMCLNLFSRETYIVHLCGDFAVLLTFGVIFPPLSLLVCTSMVIHSVIVQDRLRAMLMCARTRAESFAISHSEQSAADVRSAPIVMVSADGVSTANAATTAEQMVLMIFAAHLSRECHNFMRYVVLVSPYIIYLMMLFISFSLFDTMAASEGTMPGIGIMCAAISVTIVESFFSTLLSRFRALDR